MVRLKLENSSGGIVFLCLTYFYKNRENDCYFQDTYDIINANGLMNTELLQGIEITRSV